MKRQGLVPFPRVGRSGALIPRFYHQQMSDYNKRGMSGELSHHARYILTKFEP